MGIGDNTRHIILRRLAQTQSLQEIDFCLELWMQTHSFKQVNFIGLTSQIAFDRNAYFIHSNDDEITEAVKALFKGSGAMTLRKNIIFGQAPYIQSHFPNAGMVFCNTYGPHNSVGIFLLKQNQPKDISPEEQLFIAQELHPFSTALFAAYAQDLASHIKLTIREAEVLSWVAQGKSNTVIAEIMGISTHTIDNYLRRTYAKIGVNNRTSAAIKALFLGLTTI